jgi:hypothetical protein
LEQIRPEVSSAFVNSGGEDKEYYQQRFEKLAVNDDLDGTTKSMRVTWKKSKVERMEWMSNLSLVSLGFQASMRAYPKSDKKAKAQSLKACTSVARILSKQLFDDSKLQNWIETSPENLHGNFRDKPMATFVRSLHDASGAVLEAHDMPLAIVLLLFAVAPGTREYIEAGTDLMAVAAHEELIYFLADFVFWGLYATIRRGAEDAKIFSTSGTNVGAWFWGALRCIRQFRMLLPIFKFHHEFKSSKSTPPLERVYPPGQLYRLRDYALYAGIIKHSTVELSDWNLLGDLLDVDVPVFIIRQIELSDAFWKKQLGANVPESEKKLVTAARSELAKAHEDWKSATKDAEQLKLVDDLFTRLGSWDLALCVHLPELRGVSTQKIRSKKFLHTLPIKPPASTEKLEGALKKLHDQAKVTTVDFMMFYSLMDSELSKGLSTAKKDRAAAVIAISTGTLKTQVQPAVGSASQLEEKPREEPAPETPKRKRVTSKKRTSQKKQKQAHEEELPPKENEPEPQPDIQEFPPQEDPDVINLAGEAPQERESKIPQSESKEPQFEFTAEELDQQVRAFEAFEKASRSAPFKRPEYKKMESDSDEEKEEQRAPSPVPWKRPEYKKMESDSDEEFESMKD